MGQEVKESNPAYIYLRAFIDELARAGVEHVIACPGSRSTPLAICFAECGDMRLWMQIDERSASFFALGLAKRLRKTVVLLCTSGTAAANFFPAVVEANLSHIPLLILTADRPPELRENGAPQTINQNQLYGSHVKWFAEVALPEASNNALRYIRTLAHRALDQAERLPVGPVHLNLPLREPLIPLPGAELKMSEQADPLAWEGRSLRKPYTEVENTVLHGEIRADKVIELMDLFRQRRKGLIFVGPQVTGRENDVLVAIAHRLGYPILADPLSFLRSGPHDASQIVTSYDAFLRVDRFVEASEPEIILRFGAMPVSKPALLYMQKYSSCPQIVIDSQYDWPDPTQLVDMLLRISPSYLLQLLNTYALDEPDHLWLKHWQETDQQTQVILDKMITQFPVFFEGRIFRELETLLQSSAIIYVGNSMPVRDLDTFFWRHEASLHLVANRGANGIDGVVSSALGWGAISPREQTNILVIGDLSFLHDLNGLLAAHLYKLNLIVILVQNDGGGIFSFLPQAAYPEHFEQLFGTPTGIDVRPGVEMYGGLYHQTESWQDFRKTFQRAQEQGGLHVLEVRTERASNVVMHRELWTALEKELPEWA